jgi:hypothetical protein
MTTNALHRSQTGSPCCSLMTTVLAVMAVYVLRLQGVLATGCPANLMTGNVQSINLAAGQTYTIFDSSGGFASTFQVSYIQQHALRTLQNLILCPSAGITPRLFLQMSYLYVSGKCTGGSIFGCTDDKFTVYTSYDYHDPGSGDASSSACVQSTGGSQGVQGAIVTISVKCTNSADTCQLSWATDARSTSSNNVAT